MTATGTGSAGVTSSHRSRSGELDSLRAFAMLGVVALHSHLLPFGWIGVWLFYALSGYVVTLSVLTAEGTGGEGRMASLLAFMRRRAARILPVYYAYIVMGLGVGVAMGFAQVGLSVASLFLFFDNVTMIVGLGRVAGWPTGHLWTLSTEMQFYALYGTALCLLPRRSTRLLLVALVIVCPLGRLVAGQWLASLGWKPLDVAFGVYAGPGLHFDIFAMGALLAFARCDGRGRAAPSWLLPSGLLALGAYAVAYVLVNLLFRHAHGSALLRNILSGILFGEYREVFLYSAVGLAMTGLIALAAGGGGALRPLLALRPLQWIGRISYGGYLFHPLGLMVASMLLSLLGIQTRHGSVGAHVLQFLLCLALTLPLAAASFQWLEEPLRRRLTRARHTGSRPITAAQPSRPATL